MEKKLSKDEFIDKYVKEMLDNTPDEIINDGIKNFYKGIVNNEAYCIEDCKSMGYRFPLQVDWTYGDNIVVECDCCGKVYNQD